MYKPLSLGLAAIALIAVGTIAAPSAAAQLYPGTPQYGAITNGQNSILGRWTVTTAQGTTVAEYYPDGIVSGIVTFAGRPSPMPFYGKYSIRQMGGDRFELTVVVPQSGGRPPFRQSETMRFQGNDRIYSETNGTTAQRMR